MKRKKKGIIIASLLAVLAVGGAGVVYFLPKLSNEEMNLAGNELAYVEQISAINGGFEFTSNRYNGVVETQEVISVEADADKTIKTTFVQAGDDVKIGDKLFEYDIEEIEIQLEQSELDLEQAQAEIKSYNTQIESLEKEKNTATTNQQLSLTNQIEALRLELKRANYLVETKEKEIEKLENSIKNGVVKSPVNGTVQNVNSDGMSMDSYIKIASNGDYRIKAMVSELNISTLSENDPILVRSRIDDTMTWTGWVSGVDTAKPTQGTNAYGGETTTKYPVYVALDSTDGLLIGQHVTIELDFSRGTEDKEGLWLADYYVCDADTAPYIWAEDENALLEKRTVELGEYDEENMEYQILSGVTEDDFIAFPEDRLYEGMSTTSFIFDDAVTEPDVTEDGVGVIGNGDGEMVVY